MTNKCTGCAGCSKGLPIQIAEPAASEWKDHQTAQLVGQLTEVAREFHGAQQLRERIAHLIRPLAEKAKAAPAAQAVEPVAIAEITSASHDAAEFGERGLRLLADFQHLEYGTKLYAHATPPEPEEATIELMKLVDAWHAEMRTGNHISQGMARQRIVMAVDSLAALRATPSAPAAVAVPDERAAFEAWARCYGTWEVKRDDDPGLGTTGYTDVTLTVAWHAIKARAALAATPQNHIADAGEMVENVREGAPYDNQPR